MVSMGDLPDDIGIDYDPGPDEPGSVVEEVMLRHEGALLRRPKVTGVGIGQNAVGDDAIVVYLEEKSAAAGLPSDLEGFEIIIEVTGPIDAY